jgi:hypothetical protein
MIFLRGSGILALNLRPQGSNFQNFSGKSSSALHLLERFENQRIVSEKRIAIEFDFVLPADGVATEF